MPKGVYKHYSYQGQNLKGKRGHPVKGNKYPKMSNAGKRRPKSSFNITGLKKGWGWNKGQKMQKHGRNPVWLKKYQFGSGENHWNWKGGKCQRGKHENGIYKKWTKRIFEYDNYTCWICENRGGELQAHHLRGWAEYPEVRFELGNGVALCKECHKLYGYHNEKLKRNKTSFQAYNFNQTETWKINLFVLTDTIYNLNI